jgi:hypothetical protein
VVKQGLPSPEQLADELEKFIEWAVENNQGSSKANKPGHRCPFHWPPHPVSYSYHVLASDWTGSASFESHGEMFPVEVAKTPHGVFGRSQALWCEARGETLEEMQEAIRHAAEPLFRRQLAISDCLGLHKRFEGHINDLEPEEILRLLYCRDRDVANDARIQIETQASLGIFGPALLIILNDRRHPDRRSAQWCVLDLLEDIWSYFPHAEDHGPAIQAMQDLLWDAEDDYARTIYKAGVVLGGHLPEEEGGKVLLDCLKAPSKIGRRSAIHGLFHVVEWYPSTGEGILKALDEVSLNDTEPILREYAHGMAEDIRHKNFDHVAEPTFPDEP